MILFLGVCGPPWFFPFRVSTLKLCVSVSCAISVFVLCLSAFYFTFPAPEHPNEKPVVAGHDSRHKLYIFLGYCHEEFGYRLYDPTNKKVIRSNNVVFLEGQTLQYREPSELSYFTPGDLEVFRQTMIHDQINTWFEVFTNKVKSSKIITCTA